MSSTIRRHGPYLTITLLIVFFFITYLFTTPQPVQLFGTQLVQWASVVAYFAILVGTIDILICHLKPLRSKRIRTVAVQCSIAGNTRNRLGYRNLRRTQRSRS